MLEKKLPEQISTPIEELSQKQVSRRRFFSYAGISAGLLAAGTACNKFDIPNPFEKPKGAVDLGSGDIGILNYAYALEQLEAAFYIMVCSNFYAGVSDKEKMYLTDIRQHEIAHREFFKKALGDKAIGSLKVDFSSINFSSRSEVLGAAKAFEDLGVSAYNGAGELLQSSDYLLLAGKIVSVEARHAAAIRDLISYGDFAGDDVIDANGLDLARKPNQVLSIADKYIVTAINANNLPTS